MSEKITRRARQTLAEQVEKSLLTSGQKRVFRILLFKFYNVKDARCFPSDRQIQTQTKLNERTIRRARKALIDGGWIECVQKAPDKRRRHYRFPKLDALIHSEKEAGNCSPIQEPKNRTKCPKKEVKMSSTPIYTKTTEINQKGGVRPGSVRRQGFWNHRRPKLRERLAHLVGFIMRRAGGDASVALRVSFV